MPWEKSFDVEQALDRAKEVFLTKGYEGTSMADLLEATGLNKGSLYNAFGSKKELFNKALLRYEQEERKANLRELEALDQPVTAIKRVFDDMVEPSVPLKGCLLINTALDLPNHDAEVEATVKAGIKDLEAFFTRQLELAQSRREVSRKLNVPRVAGGLTALVVAIRVLERGALNRPGLMLIRDQAAALLEQ